MSDRKLLPGKFVWFEHVSNDAKKAQQFYGEVLGWKVRPFPMGNVAYEMILTGENWDTMIGGYAASEGKPSHWLATVSVNDVDAAANAAIENGGKVLDPPPISRGWAGGLGSLTPKGANWACSPMPEVISPTCR